MEIRGFRIRPRGARRSLRRCRRRLTAGAYLAFIGAFSLAAGASLAVRESTVAAAANNAPEITTTSPLQVTDANEQPAQPASPTVSVTSGGFHTITLSTARTCADNEIQLEGGTSAAEGNVLICHDNTFGPVCDDYWTDSAAGVACRQLGYPTGSNTILSFFGRPPRGTTGWTMSSATAQRPV